MCAAIAFLIPGADLIEAIALVSALGYFGYQDYQYNNRIMFQIVR